MLFTVFASAFAIQLFVTPQPIIDRIITHIWDRSFDVGSDKVWDSINKGVCDKDFLIMAKIRMLTNAQRQWKDIKHKYMEGSEEE